LKAILAISALFAWIPVILVLFALLPARRAVVAGSVAAWLLLPPIAIDVPGIPSYDKAAAAMLGILLATLIFEPHRLLSFHPRWFDLPMLLWCVCPFMSSVMNGLGTYDGISAATRQALAWLLPYSVGRLYLTDLESMRELAWGMVIGSTCLIPCCFFEIRMSPMIGLLVYGVGGQGAFEGTRYGLFRPHVFFSSPLELGLWMSAATLVAWWLWRTRQLKTLGGLPGGAIVAALLFTTIACRVTGAIVLLLIGMAVLWICWRRKKTWAVWALLLVAPAYYCVRMTNLWSGSQAVELARAVVGDARADSLDFRLGNEELLIAKALQQPIFGWGGWGRNLVYDEYDHQFSIIDGMWMVALGSYGIVGLTLFTVAVLLPAVLFVTRYSVSEWDQPQVAAAAALAIVVDLTLVDGLFNGMLDVVYVLAAGGLANVASSRAAPQATADKLSPAELQRQVVYYRALGRALRDQRRFLEAKNAWQCAINLLTRQVMLQPDLAALRQQWCDCANDLAWLLVNSADPAQEDTALAVSLVSQATATCPECGTYWNTLGAAYYRMQDFSAAATALERARSLSEGGTAFDHCFLAMAHIRIGNHEYAHQCLAAAMRWMEHNQPGHVELRRLCEEAISVVRAVPNRPVATGSRGE
jgi:hypothetical protein